MKKIILVILLAIILVGVVLILKLYSTKEDQASCIKEGQSATVRDKCCRGLKMVDDCLPGEPCPISLRYCVNCGNGTCDPHENWSNCSIDCKR